MRELENESITNYKTGRWNACKRVRVQLGYADEHSWCPLGRTLETWTGTGPCGAGPCVPLVDRHPARAELLIALLIGVWGSGRQADHAAVTVYCWKTVVSGL